jgi:hypothetical protein
MSKYVINPVFDNRIAIGDVVLPSEGFPIPQILKEKRVTFAAVSAIDAKLTEPKMLEEFVELQLKYMNHQLEVEDKSMTQFEKFRRETIYMVLTALGAANVNAFLPQYETPLPADQPA